MSAPAVSAVSATDRPALPSAEVPARTAWLPVVSLALATTAFVTSELLPASLLTPMAQGLGVSEGMAGQSMSVAALAAIFASLFATTTIGRFDRRWVAMGCTCGVALAALIVAVAPGYGMMLAGRLLFGFSAGIHWAMMASLVLRLVQPADVGRALSLIFGAVPLAMLLTVWAGGPLEAAFGWRGVYLIACGVTLGCALLQGLSLPRLPAARGGSILGVARLLRRPRLWAAMAALLLIFGGKFTLFPYARPYLEREAGLSAGMIALGLTGYALATLFGTSLAPSAMRRSLPGTMVLAPLLVAAAALLLLAAPGLEAGARAVVAVGALVLWGFAIGFIPVAWTRWTAAELPQEAEAAGCLQFSTMQAAVALGVICGGAALEWGGPRAPFVLGVLALVAGAVLAAAVLRRGPLSPRG